ncbi:PglL family O-oligosaccharyltransferase [Amphritea balenae]|nr:O-antigen ligase family protein [Amphritea balenae]
MQSSKTSTAITPQTTGLLLIALLFLPASFFFQPNLGGEGLSISHNITVWIAAVLTISSATLLILKQQILYYPKMLLALAAVPVSLILLGFIVDSFLPGEWLFRQLYILGGFLFLLALFQFNFSPRNIETALLIFLVAAIVHALYGISQIYWPKIIPTLRTPSNGTPYSIFQQINLHASFQATALLVSLYLLSRPLCRFSALKTRPASLLIILSTVFLSSFIVAYSGSRVGLLSATVGVIIMLLCFWRIYLTRKPLMALIIIAVISATLLGSQGINRSAAKLDALATTNSEGIAVSGASSRVNIYAVALSLFKQEPFTGYGIGSFQKVWLDEKATYLDKHPDALFPKERLSHPHNEFMFWLVEGGLIAITGILITLIAILYAALSCGWRRGTAYLALLLPIGLHTQVELPFYISNISWFMLLFLIFIVVRHHTKQRKIRLSRSAELTSGAAASLLLVGTTVVMLQAIQANTSIVRFLQGRMAEPALLESALQSPVFRDTAEIHLMRTLLLRELNAGQGSFAPQFISWAEPVIEYKPITQLYIDLARAYLAVGQPEQALQTIRKGQRYYPALPEIASAAKQIENLISAPASASDPGLLPETQAQ